MSEERRAEGDASEIIRAKEERTRRDRNDMSPIDRNERVVRLLVKSVGEGLERRARGKTMWFCYCFRQLFSLVFYHRLERSDDRGWPARRSACGLGRRGFRVTSCDPASTGFRLAAEEFESSGAKAEILDEL